MSHHHRYFIIAISAAVFCPGVDSFHFRAVWILSTRLLSVVGFVVARPAMDSGAAFIRGASQPSVVMLRKRNCSYTSRGDGGSSGA